jgi:urease accessory protein
MKPCPRPLALFAAAAAALVLLQGAPAFAHTEAGVAGGLVSGLLHPVVGFDHLVAMLAVGLWGAQLQAPAIWLLPVTFPVVMALGAVLGVAGVPLPFVEFGVAGSALVLGSLVALRARPATWLATLLVGLFAVFHGHAHGTELPDASNALAYGVGFVLSTGLLHLAGILIGVLVRWPAGERLVRACGIAVAAVGALVLAGSLGLGS